MERLAGGLQGLRKAFKASRRSGLLAPLSVEDSSDSAARNMAIAAKAM
jgi:hypothetical protein